MGKPRIYVVLVMMQFSLASSLAFCWWTEGHAIVVRAAAQALPPEMPAFFRQSSDALAWYAAEPDLWKNPGTPVLRDREWPEHFIDWELLENRTLPPLPWEFVALCERIGRRPRDVGLLPYALAEWTERLALSFAEHRAAPQNPYICQKCLVYGGILAHYAGDLAQPLHLTIHYDGYTTAGAPSPRSGIHEKMDALLQAAGLEPLELSREIRPLVFGDLLTSTVAEIHRNRRAIPTVYELENNLPPVRRGEGVAPDWKPGVRVHAFAYERAHAAAFLTASYWLTAWERSKTLASHLPRHAGGSAAPLPVSASPRETPVVRVLSVLGVAVFPLAVVALMRRGIRG